MSPISATGSKRIVGPRLDPRGEPLRRALPFVGVFFGLAMLASGAGCATSSAVQAAHARDWARLERALSEEEKSGALDRGEARSVAKAIATGNIDLAKGDKGASLVLSLQPCAAALEGSLEDRSEKTDDVAAAAAGVLLSAGLVDKDEYARYALKNDSRAAFRALGARSLVTQDLVDPRRVFYRDLDERVRLGALRAALDFSSPSDLDAVFEAARLDPMPAARSTAARALGRIGGRPAVLALRDLWNRADPPLREAIADGWGQPASFGAGGREELRWAAEHETGEAAIAAAVELVRHAPAASPDGAAGLGVLTRSVKLGTRTERVFAIEASPSTPEILAAVREAKDDSDPGIAIVALSRLIREMAGTERKTATDKLLAIAKGDAQEALRAQSELATFGDPRVVPLLEKAMASSNGFSRALAARGFVALGRSPKAARVLADRDADVRSQIACAILAATE